MGEHKRVMCYSLKTPAHLRSAVGATNAFPLEQKHLYQELECFTVSTAQILKKSTLR